LAERAHPRLLVVHPDPTVGGQVVAALAARGYHAFQVPRTPAPAPPDPDASRPGTGQPESSGDGPAPTVVVIDHTQLPISAAAQVLALVPTHEHGDILAAFAAGADDVLAGPLRPAELATRVAILARTAARDSLLSVGPVTIDTLAHTVTLDGRPLDLTPTEYDLLARLATAPGRVFTKQDLAPTVSAGRAVSPATTGSARPNRRVDTQVARLRRRLGKHRGLLVTVWGVGYRLG
jgi:DNA-binding winged helix-turn-helix (wHTH) protein